MFVEISYITFKRLILFFSDDFIHNLLKTYNKNLRKTKVKIMSDCFRIKINTFKIKLCKKKYFNINNVRNTENLFT